MIRQFICLSFISNCYLLEENLHLQSFRYTYIGILTQPNDIYKPFWDDSNWDFKNSYLATSYIKYVESTGAQSVVIPWDMPWDQIELILKNTHGIIIPGGNADIMEGNPFKKVIHQIFEWSKMRNDNGYPFFLIGICMGFEVLSQELARKTFVLTTGMQNFDEKAVIVDDIGKMSDSAMFGGSVKEVHEIVKVLKTKGNIRFAHNEGLSVEDFYNISSLKNENDLIAISKDSEGKSFVSIIENKNYPFYGMQFHPEKNSWEKRYKKYYKLNRDGNTLAVQNGFVSKIIEWSRKMRNYDFEFQEYDKRVMNFFSYNFFNFPSFYDIFESLIMLGDMSNCNGDCSKKVISSEMEDHTMKSYQSMRNKFRESEMNDSFNHTFIDPDLLQRNKDKEDQ